MTWLTALTAWPAPIGPTWVIVRPIAVRTGRARSTSAASPPTKIVSVAFLAPSLPPETGASTIGRSTLGEPRGEIPAARWGDGRAIDDERARARALGDAVGSEQDRFHVGRVGDADDRDPGIGDGVAGGLGDRRRQVGELRRAARRPVPGGDVEAGAGEVGGHRRAHRAEPEEGDPPALWGGFACHDGRVASGGGPGWARPVARLGRLVPRRALAHPVARQDPRFRLGRPRGGIVGGTGSAGGYGRTSGRRGIWAFRGPGRRGTRRPRQPRRSG